MAESLVHLHLVSRLVSYIQGEYQPIYELAIFHDLPNLLGADKPPRIGGFIPDVYAVDIPTSIVILGEAKTEDDLETQHSRKQLTAFFQFLQVQSCGVLVLSVPWQAKARAKNLVGGLRKELQCAKVQTAVITGLVG